MTIADLGARYVGPPGLRNRRAIRDGLAAGGLIFAAYLFVVVAPAARTVGFDAFAYWSVDLAHPYARVAGELGAFPYTPVAARLFAPAALLQWPSFWWLWSAVLVGTVIWLGRTGWVGGFAGPLLILAFPPVALELYHGNVHLLIAAAIALGMRYPAAWAFVLLTKVTPGVGLIWFAVRREWRQLGIALGVTAAIVAASLLIDGRLWREWIIDGLLPVANGPTQQFYIGIPLLIRLPAAALLVAWGARTDRSWTVPAGAALALPILWISGLSVLAAIPALERLRLASNMGARIIGHTRAGNGTGHVTSALRRAISSPSLPSGRVATRVAQGAAVVGFAFGIWILLGLGIEGSGGTGGSDALAYLRAGRAIVDETSSTDRTPARQVPTSTRRSSPRSSRRLRSCRRLRSSGHGARSKSPACGSRSGVGRGPDSRSSSFPR